MKRAIVTLPGLLALAIMLLLMAGLGAWLFLPGQIAEQRAHALTPAMMPGARLVQDMSGSIAGAANHMRIYIVDADMTAVHRWFEREMPGFSLCSASIRADCFSNEKCDDSLAGKLLNGVMFLGQQVDVRTCVSIVIEPELPNGERTLVHVNLGWPSDES